jgi:hypothetical protein
MNKDYDMYAKYTKENVLPTGFDRWELADKDGWTVAHIAAWRGHLPDNFDQWDMADKDGATVAHSCARWGHLPAGFDQWGLANNDGLTVLCQLLLSTTRQDKYVTRWEKKGPLCKTDIAWNAFKTALPEIYQKYTVVELFDDIDTAHEVHLI